MKGLKGCTNQENICFLNSLVEKYRCIDNVELLPFKKICKVKYDKMGIDFPFAVFDEPSAEKITNLKALLKAGV